MSLKHLVLITATSSIVFFAGCGTIGARSMTKNPPPFAGLRLDVETLGDLYTNKEGDERGWAYWLGIPLVTGIVLADVPLSVVFDVVCLPTDLKSQKQQSEEKDTRVKEQTK
jgi:uncharacterized protein YceK